MKPEDIELAYKNALAPGQPFRFHCTQCGKCCKNREDILLNPYDLHRVSQALGIPHDQVVSRYCTVYIGDSSRFPCVLLTPVGPEKACPLLKGNKCSVHRGKPTVCALYPLGRAIRCSTSHAPTSPAEGEKSGMFYFLNGATCGKNDEEHTVEEWLSEFDLQESEEWFLLWSEVLGDLAPRLMELEKKLSPKLMEPVFNAVFVGMYLNYQPFGSFLSQFKKNVEKVKGLLQMVETGIK